MPLPLVVRQLLAWRERNSLSQRGAVEVMNGHGLDVTRATLQTWEQGHRQPGKLATKAISDFLAAHPRIKNPPYYPPGPAPKKR